MENLTGGTPPVRYLPCVVPCKLYFIEDHTLDTFVVILDGEQINNVYETTAYSLGDGQHIISAFAKDAAGNETTKTAVFTVDGTQITITAGGTTDITDNSASLYLNVSNVKSDTKATFYKAEIQTALKLTHQKEYFHISSIQSM